MASGVDLKRSPVACGRRQARRELWEWLPGECLGSKPRRESIWAARYAPTSVAERAAGQAGRHDTYRRLMDVGQWKRRRGASSSPVGGTGLPFIRLPTARNVSSSWLGHRPEGALFDLVHE